MEKLQEYRQRIEEIDAQIAKLFCQRMEICTEIGEYKRQNNLPIFDGKREEELKAKNLKNVDQKYKDSYQQLFELMLKLSKNYQL